MIDPSWPMIVMFSVILGLPVLLIFGASLLAVAMFLLSQRG